MIRALTVLFLLIIYCIIGPIVWLIMWLVHFKSKDASNMIALRVLRPGVRLALKVTGAKIDYIGLQNLPDKNDGPVMYCLNHRSIFDVVILYAILKVPAGFIAKKELRPIPFLSWWMDAVNCLYLDRKNVREGMKTILKAVEYVKGGLSMAVFPEGTRNRDQEHPEKLLPFHDGSFKIAEKGNVPIIPIAMFNTSKTFEDQFPKMRPNHIKVMIGEPVDVKSLDPNDKKFIGKYMHEKMEGMIREIME